MKKIFNFFESRSLSRYIKRKQLIESKREKEAKFDFDRNRILQLLLQDKTTEESIKLFDVVNKLYFDTMKKRGFLLGIEKSIIETNLKKHNKI